MKNSIKCLFVLSFLFGQSVTAQDEPFLGGSGDGFSYDIYENINNSIFYGGEGNGFSYTSIINPFNNVYKGGSGDGFSYSANNSTINNIFIGGNSDGFGYSAYGHVIYWTGAVGTGWNVEGNWENDKIPEYFNSVVIPADVPNFPFVNSGLFRIGYYTNEGDYLCEKIKINLGAELTTRLNCFVENYNVISIRGKLFVKNGAENAFVNKPSGIIDIMSAGSMIFKQ